LSRRIEAKLRELQELLADVVDARGGAPDAVPSESHWELPVLPPPDPDGRLSSTDLLTWWFRARARDGSGGAAADWDQYFARDGRDENDDAGPPPARRPRGAPLRDADDDVQIESLFPEPEAQLAEEHAQAAVDCLYEFIHAFGRRDVDAAMKLISDGYHAIEWDQEVDYLKFRQHLEAGLDALRDAEIEVSLTEAPEPVRHPHGILIDAQIQIDQIEQIDHARGADARTSMVERRVAVIGQEPDGEWRIRGFGLVDR
jgi:hypothetical protein